jgi:quercetin dioxygenase-like cupin family protein
MKPTSKTSSLPKVPRSIQINRGKNHTPLLGGPPDSISLHSGYVELMPGESVGLHSTEEKEEMIVPLSGSGELTSPGLDPLPITVDSVLYNPPHTPHDVVNTGNVPLRYVYIVSSSSNNGNHPKNK